MPEEPIEASSFEDNLSRTLELLYTPAWVGKRRTMEDNKPIETDNEEGVGDRPKEVFTDTVWNMAKNINEAFEAWGKASGRDYHETAGRLLGATNAQYSDNDVKIVAQGLYREDLQEFALQVLEHGKPKNAKPETDSVSAVSASKLTDSLAAQVKAQNEQIPESLSPEEKMERFNRLPLGEKLKLAIQYSAQDAMEDAEGDSCKDK